MGKAKDARAKKYGCLKSFLIMVLVLLILVGAGYVGAHFMLSKLDRQQLNDLTISEEVLSNKKGSGVSHYLEWILARMLMKIHVRMR